MQIGKKEISSRQSIEAIAHFEDLYDSLDCLARLLPPGFARSHPFLVDFHLVGEGQREVAEELLLGEVIFEPAVDEGCVLADEGRLGGDCLLQLLQLSGAEVTSRLYCRSILAIKSLMHLDLVSSEDCAS